MPTSTGPAVPHVVDQRRAPSGAPRRPADRCGDRARTRCRACCCWRSVRPSANPSWCSKIGTVVLAGPNSRIPLRLAAWLTAGSAEQIGLHRPLEVQVVVELLDGGLVREAVEEVQRAEAGFHLVRAWRCRAAWAWSSCTGRWPGVKLGRRGSAAGPGPAPRPAAGPGRPGYTRKSF